MTVAGLYPEIVSSKAKMMISRRAGPPKPESGLRGVRAVGTGAPTRVFELSGRVLQFGDRSVCGACSWAIRHADTEKRPKHSFDANSRALAVQ